MSLSQAQTKISPNGLMILQALAGAGGISDWQTAPTVSRQARLQGQTLNAPTVYRTLSRLRSYVEYRTIDGVRRFHIRKEGHILLGSTPAHGPIFVTPGTPWSTQRELRNFLREHTRGFLFIIDPYISEETLDIISDVRLPIKILTSNLGRKNKESEFLRAYKKFKKEKVDQVEMRQVASSELHGRYILTELQGWVIDHSLQDLGTKPALVLPLHLETVYNQIQLHFTTLFSKGVLVT